MLRSIDTGMGSEVCASRSRAGISIVTVLSLGGAKWREGESSRVVESHFLLLFGLRPVMCCALGCCGWSIDRRHCASTLRVKQRLFMQSEKCIFLTFLGFCYVVRHEDSGISEIEALDFRRAS